MVDITSTSLSTIPPQDCSQATCESFDTTVGGINFSIYAFDENTTQITSGLLSKAMMFCNGVNLTLPGLITVIVVSSPSHVRAHANSATRTIILDADDGANTVVHELAHVATPNLCDAEHWYHYMCEGFAQWLEDKYLTKGRGYFPNGSTVSHSININRCSAEFFIPGNDCYIEGSEVWRKIEKKHGTQAVFEIIKEIEFLQQPTKEDLDEIFETHTGDNPGEWLTMNAKGDPKDYGFLSEIFIDFYAVSSADLSIGVSLHHMGSFGRASLHGCFNLFDIFGSEIEDDVQRGSRLGYRLSLAPLYPFLQWNGDAERHGLRFFETSVEAGFTSVISSCSDAEVCSLRIAPFGQVTIDAIAMGSYNRISAGASLLAFPGGGTHYQFHGGYRFTF